MSYKFSLWNPILWAVQGAARTFREAIVNNPEQSLLLRTQLDTLNNYLLNYNIQDTVLDEERQI